MNDDGCLDEVVYEEYEGFKSEKAIKSTRKRNNSSLTDKPESHISKKPLFSFNNSEISNQYSGKEDWNKLFQLHDGQTVKTEALNRVNETQEVKESETINRNFNIARKGQTNDSAIKRVIINDNNRMSFPTSKVSLLTAPILKTAKRRASEIALDRPAHWGKQTIKYATKVKSDQSISQFNHLRASNYQPRRSSLPATTVSNDIPDISFKPNWMKSISSAPREINTKNDEIMQMDESQFNNQLVVNQRNIHRSPIVTDRSQSQFDYAGPSDSNHILQSPSHRVFIESLNKNVSPDGKLGKAKVGSLRYRMQKLRRTYHNDHLYKIIADSNNPHNSSDFRDPRSRSLSWVDCTLSNIVLSVPYVIAQGKIDQVFLRSTRLPTIREDIADESNYINSNISTEMTADDLIETIHPLKSLKDNSYPVYFKSSTFLEYVSEMKGYAIDSVEMFEGSVFRLYDPELITSESKTLLLCIGLYEINSGDN